MEWIVDGREKITLISFLKSKVSKDVSQKALKRSIDAGLCFVNGRRERFSNTVLLPKDKVKLFEEENPVQELFSQENILFEDEAILVFNKPWGFVCDKRAEDRMRALLAHRLDKETTGVLLFAKGEKALKNLTDQFRLHTIKKTYLAIVEGYFEKKEGNIENYLVPATKYAGQTLWKVGRGGLFAKTRFVCLKTGARASLLELYPETGRTHQLRVHMKALSHPIIGDRLYGDKVFKEAPRLCLHAKRLEFDHPVTKKRMVFEAPLPVSFCKAIEALCAI
jgi:23S rRNA pseudouridine1911/1915/1917 synthase